MIEKGMKVKGAFSGKYLGVVQSVSNRGTATINGPGGAILFMSVLMLDPIPEMVTKEQARIWVV